MRLQKRLRTVMVEGNLTIIDLARWLNKPFSTIREWVVRGREVRASPQDLEIILERLKVIERRIRLRAGLPVPQFPITPGQGRRKGVRADTIRIAYLNKLMARKKL